MGGGGGYADPPLMGFGGGRGEPRMTERRMDGAYSALEDDHLASSTGYIVSFFRVFPGKFALDMYSGTLREGSPFV